MVTRVENHEGFTLHLHVPLLVQVNANQDEEIVESPINEFNHAELEDSRPQVTKPVARGATNSGFPLCL